MTLSIGEVARDTGLAVTAIRYYDEIGLLETEARVGGKRRFPESTTRRVEFVTRAKEAGFTLDEIRRILDDSFASRNRLVAAKQRELEARRDRLDVMIGLLGEIADCGCEAIDACALLDR